MNAGLFAEKKKHNDGNDEDEGGDDRQRARTLCVWGGVYDDRDIFRRRA